LGQFSDIKEVPILINPYNGKPFIYQRDGDHAVLTSETDSPYVPWRHEITFGRKGK
jgi:hypothetical protein